MKISNISLPGLALTVVIILIIGKQLISGLNLNGVGYSGTIPWMTHIVPIGTGLIVVGIIAYGVYSSKTTKGPELVAQIAGFLIIAFFVFGSLVGWDKVAGYFQDTRTGINNHLSGSAGGQSSSGSARDLLCIPENFIQKQIVRTAPVRFNAELRCPVFAGSKSLTTSLQIRFNDEEWQPWEGNTPMPKYRGTIRYMDVLGTGTVKVQFGL